MAAALYFGCVRLPRGDRFHSIYLRRRLQTLKEMTMWILFDGLLLAAGYAASIYSWPTIKVWANGVTGEAANLRVRAAQLEAKIRAL